MNTTEAVKERPIPFRPEMVRAILNGSKTQTRRLIKGYGNAWHISKPLGDWGLSEHPHCYDGEERLWRYVGNRKPVKGDWIWKLQTAVDDDADFLIPNRFGKVGDRLWVREVFYYDVCPWANGGSLKEIPSNFDNESLYYRADGECCDQIPECQCADVGKPRWRQARFMPRWASRITLEITEVRVERLQDISPEDCVAEGIKPDMETHAGQYWRESAVSGYQSLWESIHGAGSWEANPWLWVISFKRLEAS